MLINEALVLAGTLINDKGASGLVIMKAPFPGSEFTEGFTALIAITFAKTLEPQGKL